MAQYACPIGGEPIEGTDEQAAMQVPCRRCFEQENGSDRPWWRCSKGCKVAFDSSAKRTEHEAMDH